MRVAIFLAPLLVAATVVLSGCGYAGEPKPPALKRPLKVTDLAATERGSKVVVTFTLPKETTEGLPIDLPPDIELRAGLQPPGDWNLNEWESHADLYPVPALVIPPGGLASALQTRRPKSTRGPRAASGSAAAPAKAAKPGVLRKAKATYPPIPPALFDRTVSFDAAKYAGHMLIVGVRVRGPKGRDDGWSIAHLEVFPVLPVPANLRLTDGPNAVHLQWTSDAPAYRIYRRLPPETEWTALGESARPSFDDPAPAFGKAAQYYVESIRKTGDVISASDPSETVSFTATDRFPPAVPAGLAAIAGSKSIELVWDRVEDADLAAYRIYRDGKRIADAALIPSYSDKDVKAGTKYQYQVTAVDQAGNESAKSYPVEATME